MNAVALAATPTLTRRTGIACARCGEGRPASHLRCYVCGQRLTGEAGSTSRLAWLRHAGSWPVWAGARWLFGRFSRRKPTVAAYGVPVLQLRTWGDRAARWYTYLSVAAVALWLFAGSRGVTPLAAASTPTEACTWLDTQRVELTSDVARATAAQREVLAQRLSELAARLAGGGAA